MAELTYRPATLDDAALAADLMTASYPSLPVDPVMTRFRWDHPRRGYFFGRFIAERAGRPIAFLAWTHGPWEMLPNRHCEVEVFLDRAVIDHGRLLNLWSWICDLAVAEGAGLLLGYANEDEQEMVEALAAVGFKRDRVGKISLLDLVKHGERITETAADARARLAAGGFELVTLAAWKRPDKFEKLYDLDARTRQDIPHTLPILVETLADFEARTTAPDRPADRTWIVLDKDIPVAMTYLKFPPVRGTVWTGYTCTSADHRGKGLAKAVKLQSLAQAVELGVPMVMTDNDEENSPMLHINKALGYEPRPGFVAYLKRVESPRDA
ncbi:MAG: GNAT family N-acetyltransferase [Candidatus Dormibacterales bacterium]